MNLDYSYNPQVKSSYIIRIEGNEISENLALRCSKSCEEVGQPYEFFSAVDGTKEEIYVPEEKEVLNLLKLTNTTLTNTEISCLLSHFLLWVKCVEFDQPIVILEHDAIMVKPYLEHPFLNAISYLGSNEQYNGIMPLMFPMPPHGQVNRNHRFMLRAHAYSIDPMIARRLVAKIINYGIFSSADVIMRSDEFTSIQEGFYAYDSPYISTIKGREERDNDKEEDRLHRLLISQ
jgi:hypothetical protein